MRFSKWLVYMNALNLLESVKVNVIIGKAYVILSFLRIVLIKFQFKIKKSFPLFPPYNVLVATAG